MGILSLIPFRDWIYGTIIVGAGILVWHTYNKYEAAVKYQETVKAESKVALDTANQRITDLTADYDKGLKANEVVYENELAAASQQHTADSNRLRQLSAARDADAVLHGSAGTAAEAAAWAERVSALESISQGLADALRQDDAQASECWRDRDELTNK
jgi:hypothetical protein